MTIDMITDCNYFDLYDELNRLENEAERQRIINLDLLDTLEYIVQQFHDPFSTPQASLNTARLRAERAIARAKAND